jgi:hypothetical protein
VEEHTWQLAITPTNELWRRGKGVIVYKALIKNEEYGYLKQLRIKRGFCKSQVGD